MTDRRLTPANARVAEAGWEDRVDAPDYVQGTWQSVHNPLADLRAAPAGARDRQLVTGERFLVLEDRDGWSFGRADRDGYVGYIESAKLGDDIDATHLVAALASHSYTAPDMKSPETGPLSFGAQLRVIDERHKFFEIEGGSFVPKPHLRPLRSPFRDPATVAQLFFGTPYLWGGNSAWGIDCSGLIQAACLACDIPCPGDTNLQEAALGEALPDGSALTRGDLLFWKGHVAMAVDEATLIHANAHHMAVAYEPAAAAITRIEAQGDGPVTAHKRLNA